MQSRAFPQRQAPCIDANQRHALVLHLPLPLAHALRWSYICQPFKAPRAPSRSAAPAAKSPQQKQQQQRQQQQQQQQQQGQRQQEQQQQQKQKLKSPPPSPPQLEDPKPKEVKQPQPDAQVMPQPPTSELPANDSSAATNTSQPPQDSAPAPAGPLPAAEPVQLQLGFYGACLRLC
jgi:hypothetical protein